MAAAFTATSVILAGMYLIKKAKKNQYCRILRGISGFSIPGSVFSLECLRTDDVGDAECSRYNCRARNLFMSDKQVVRKEEYCNTFIVYPLKLAPVQAYIIPSGATV
jgi:hypothetical protein